MSLKTRKEFVRRRHLRLRKLVHGTPERPRMAVAVTIKHMYVQFIDDAAGVTLAAASTAGEGFEGKHNIAGARQLGQQAAAVARAKGIEAVVFDRGGRKYHGRVKAIADAAREAGLKF